MNGARHLLADGAEVEHAVAEDAALAAALVEADVGAHASRDAPCASHDVPKSTPTSSSAVSASSTSPGGPAPSRASEANATAAAATWPFMSSAPAPPDLAVDEVARPRIALPLARIGENRVRVRHQEQARPVAAREPRDDVRALGGLRHELRLGRRSARGSAASTSAARVSFPGGLTVSSRRSSWRSAVTSSRRVTRLRPSTAPSARSGPPRAPGRSTVWTSRPSTSTGVPCVPTTASPITRATTR